MAATVSPRKATPAVEWSRKTRKAMAPGLRRTARLAAIKESREG